MQHTVLRRSLPFLAMEQNTATGRVQIHAHVEPEIRAELAALARVNDRSIAAEIRRALVEHVRHEQSTREKVA
jgi:hypothetical protein